MTHEDVKDALRALAKRMSRIVEAYERIVADRDPSDAVVLDLIRAEVGDVTREDLNAALVHKVTALAHELWAERNSCLKNLNILEQLWAQGVAIKGGYSTIRRVREHVDAHLKQLMDVATCMEITKKPPRR